MSVRLAVFGSDVSRSLSPTIHAAAAEAVGIDVRYDAISASSSEAFLEALDALRAEGGRGANVTIPYKLDALAYATELSEAARAIGAVNTLSFEGERVHGDNTDGPGFARVLEGRDLSRVRVLGAGGSARAVVWAALSAGAGRVEVASRRPEQREALTSELGGVPCPFDVGAPPTLVVATLPKGEAVADLAMASFDAAARPVLVDLAYASPTAPSPLVARARAAGLEAEDGLGLLAEQGALSFVRWTGAALEPVRAAMHAALGRSAPRQS